MHWGCAHAGLACRACPCGCRKTAIAWLYWLYCSGVGLCAVQVIEIADVVGLDSDHEPCLRFCIPVLSDSPKQARRHGVSLTDAMSRSALSPTVHG